jgi:hypothetical protein
MSAPTAKAILAELRPLGQAGYKRILLSHGAKEPCLGVKIEELKKVLKRVGTDHRLALDLYATGVYDAMYLAGLVADDARMTRRDLQAWVAEAHGPLLTWTVPWVAAGSPRGWATALEWIDSGAEAEAQAGWATLSTLVSVKDDAELDLRALGKLLERAERAIHRAPNDVRSEMNRFVIAVGSFVKPLSQAALGAGERIGPVTIDVGNTACRVPFAPDAVRKAGARGAIGRKRKAAKC